MDNYEARREFVSECIEILEHAERAVVELERAETKTHLLNTIFRYFHTLKGNAYMSEFDTVGQFTHDLESLLSSMRSEELEVTHEITELFLKSIDILAEFFNKCNDDEHLDKNAFDPGTYGEALASKLVEIGKNPESTPKSMSESIQFGFFNMDLIKHAEKQSKGSTVETEKIKIPSKAEFKEIFGDYKPKVLVVDDDEGVAEVAKGYLRKFADAEIATSGNDGLNLIEEKQFDTIVSDIKMPRMTGVEFIRKVRLKGIEIPVIFFSGHAENEHLKECLNLGAFAFLDKPFDREQFVASVQSACRLAIYRRKVRELSSLLFNTYMNVTTFYEAIKGENDEISDELESLRTRTEHRLQQVSDLTHDLLKI